MTLLNGRKSISYSKYLYQVIADSKYVTHKVHHYFSNGFYKYITVSVFFFIFQYGYKNLNNI